MLLALLWSALGRLGVMRYQRFQHDPRRIMRSACTDATWFVATERSVRNGGFGGPSHEACVVALQTAARSGDQKALRAALRAAVRLLGHRMSLGLRAALRALRSLLTAVRVVAYGHHIEEPSTLRTAPRQGVDALPSPPEPDRLVMALTAAPAAPPLRPEPHRAAGGLLTQAA